MNRGIEALVLSGFPDRVPLLSGLWYAGALGAVNGDIAGRPFPSGSLAVNFWSRSLGYCRRATASDINY